MEAILWCYKVAKHITPQKKGHPLLLEGKKKGKNPEKRTPTFIRRKEKRKKKGQKKGHPLLLEGKKKGKKKGHPFLSVKIFMGVLFSFIYGCPFFL